MTRRLAAAALAAALAFLAARLSPAQSMTGSVEARVDDDRGKPVADAVVSVSPAAASPPPPAPGVAPVVMDQQNKEFVPHVLAVPIGTPVAFPNRDNIRHHVYSFSTAKRFELPLYIGTPAAPVVFDRPGVVVLGCNIHDWMVGYVYVLATPYFAKTGQDGWARVGELPAGAYEVRVWHPRMKADSEKTGQAVTIAAREPDRLTFVVALKPEQRGPRRPAGPAYERPQS
jgi:plastocyanin